MVSHKKLRDAALCANLFITAHFHAATHPKTRLLHRDISSGNLLILPKLGRGSEGVIPSITYTGILSDWEMSKLVDDHQTNPVTSQAVGMVCISHPSLSCFGLIIGFRGLISSCQ